MRVPKMKMKEMNFSSTHPYLQAKFYPFPGHLPFHIDLYDSFDLLDTARTKSSKEEIMMRIKLQPWETQSTQGEPQPVG